ncbi:hypothetical protein IRT45_09650, partial [Nocardia sp. BSTN01]|uniref:hypothetical protein n=1 Tax=Nocardia sp. BSTN01 TaxID=2783665 RepID=UPI001E05FADB
MTPEAELLDIIAGFRRQVGELSVWSAGPERLHALLITAITPRAEAARRGTEISGFPWESFVELLVKWHFDNPIGSSACREGDVMEAMQLAIKFMRIDPIGTALRVGGYKVRRNGGAFRISYRWDMSAEAADLYLERSVRPRKRRDPSTAEVDWASSQLRGRLNLFTPPIELLRTASSRAFETVIELRSERPEGYLPDEFDLGDGLKVGQMIAVIAGLMGIAELGELAHQSVDHPGISLVHAPRNLLVDWLVQLREGLSSDTVEAAIDRLMVGPRRSLRTSLLIPDGDSITFLPLFMFPRTLDAVLLRTAASDDSRFGPIGKRQGGRSGALSSWLKQIPGVKVLERLKIKDENRVILGDLDVIALDPIAQKGIIFEVKWPIEAVTLSDALGIERWISKGAEQLDAIRKELRERPELVKFPPGWPNFRDIEWSWGVCTPDQLTPKPLTVPDMKATSFRYLTSLDGASKLEDVINIVQNPDFPKKNLHYEIRPARMEFGRHIVKIDSLVLADTSWVPTFGRVGDWDSIEGRRCSASGRRCVARGSSDDSVAPDAGRRKDWLTTFLSGARRIFKGRGADEACPARQEVLMRAWALLTKVDDRSWESNNGYPDVLGATYIYDSVVSNHRRVQVGDMVVLRNSTSVLGVSRIDRIDSETATKDRYVCPKCRRGGQVQRTTNRKGLARYLCRHSNCRNEFDVALHFEQPVTLYTASYGAQWQSLDGALAFSMVQPLLDRAQQSAIRRC